ncbi:MAG: extradiol dioxygenase family protein [Flavobacteriales bacterium]|jgi:extradiol dioxygenase family protein
MTELRPFHLAIPVKEIVETRAFYRDTLGFEEGRSSDRWVDFNFFGHQLVIHLVDNLVDSKINPVDGHEVPVPHFGVVLTISQWKAMAEKLQQATIDFIIPPHIRFEGEVGEQATMFFKDPSGNALEFKAFNNLESLFCK